MTNEQTKAKHEYDYLLDIFTNLLGFETVTSTFNTSPKLVRARKLIEEATVELKNYLPELQQRIY